MPHTSPFQSHSLPRPQLQPHPSPPLPPPPPADATQISLHAIIPGDTTKNALIRTQGEQTTTLAADGSLTTTLKLKTTLLNAETDIISLRLSTPTHASDAPPVSISIPDTPKIRDHALRTTADGQHFLDLRLATPLKKDETLDITLHLASAPLPNTNAPLLLTIPIISAGEGAQTYNGTLDVTWDGHFSLASINAQNLYPSDAATASALAAKTRFAPQINQTRKARFNLNQNPSLQFSLTPARDNVTLDNLTLRGNLQPDGRLGFMLEATARARIDGATLPLLTGDAALRTLPESSDYTIRATPGAGKLRCQLAFPKTGDFPIRLEFDARVTESDDWRQINFAIPAARIATLSLGGFPEQTKFLTDIMPALQRAPSPDNTGLFTGHPAADGTIAFSWMTASADTDGRLFYSTEEISQIIVSPGLLRQTSAFTYKVLQGKLDTLRVALTGDGEILRVTAPDILSWEIEPAISTAPAAPTRHLIVHLSQPVTTATTLTIETQTPLGDFPARFTPLALAPLGGVRHSGFVRVSNEGAVRLESTPISGLTQVAPALFPAATPANPDTQTFVYRISGYDSSMRIQAGNILPETSLSTILVYTVGENDLAIDADLELEVREAPLREFLLHIPAGYIVNNNAASTAEFILAPPPPPPPPGQPALRELKIIFPKPILGRHLLNCRLERDRAASLATWTLEPIAFPGPGIKSMRGFIGIAAAPGLRITPATTPAPAGLTEIAPAFFPKKIPGLQQAWRLRDTSWFASVKIERLDMTVQSDALHLFAIREGLVSASTMINYAITGAPLGSFRFEVPPTLRNLEFSGRDIRSWKRDEATGNIEVNLHKPVSGAFTLLGTYDLPLDPRGGATGFTGLRPLGVQSEQGFVIITSDLQFNVTHDAISPALIAVEPGEIPAEYRMMYDAPLLAAYQYTARPFDLRLGLAPRSRGATVNQVIDFASLQTRIARDGQVITEAHYVVKSHGHPHLRISVPGGLRLWTARVDDVETLPVVDGGSTLIPMPPRTDANAIVTVDLRFAGTPSDTTANARTTKASVRLTAPLLDAPVISTRWQISPDQGRRLEFRNGNLAPSNANSLPPPVTGLRSIIAGLIGRRGMVLALLGALGLGLLGSLVFAISLRLRRAARATSARVSGAFATLITIASLLILGAVFLHAITTRPPTSGAAGPLEFTAPIHLGNPALFLEIASLPAVASAPATTLSIVMTQWILLIAGAACMLLALTRRARLLRILAWTLLGMGALLSPNGIAWLTAIAALFVAGETLLPGMRGFRPLPPPPPPRP